MLNIQKTLVGISLLGMLGLSACANPYEHVDLGVTKYGYGETHAVTEADVVHQKTVVEPRCRDYGEKTQPNPWVAALAFGWNNFLPGLFGEAIGFKLDLAAVGAKAASKEVVGAGLNEGAAAASLGGAGGVNTTFAMQHAVAQGCMTADAAGYHQMSTSWAERELAKNNGKIVFTRPDEPTKASWADQSASSSSEQSDSQDGPPPAPPVPPVQ